MRTFKDEKMTDCLGKPAHYWYDAFRIAEGLRADAERRVEEYKPDAMRLKWLIAQSSSVQDSVLRPTITPELLETPERWPDVVRAAIDAASRDGDVSE
jgi:hypothetical protein